MLYWGMYAQSQLPGDVRDIECRLRRLARHLSCPLNGQRTSHLSVAGCGSVFAVQINPCLLGSARQFTARCSVLRPSPQRGYGGTSTLRPPTIVAGHSMGGALALRWAAEHTDRVRSVLTFGAPLYQARAEADEHVARMARMDALLAGDGPLPRAACAWICRHGRADVPPTAAPQYGCPGGQPVDCAESQP
ncbi:MAG: alpha/beta fold hydrolase [Geodermatophilaceae bacterium]